MKKNHWKGLTAILAIVLVAILTFAAAEYVEVLRIGDLTIDDDLVVTDDQSVGGNLAVIGNTTGGGTLVQTGSITSVAGLAGATLTLTGTSFVWDPGSLVDGTQTSSDVVLSGAALGDAAIAGAGVDVADMLVSATVTAADTVTVVLQNETAGTLDLASSTWYVYVILDD